MKRFRIIMALLLTIVFTFMTGCSGTEISNMSVDDSLRSTAHQEAKSLKEWEALKGGLEIQKFVNRYELVDVQSQREVYYIDNVDKFYEVEDPYDNFEFREEAYELNSEDLEELEQAKELACKYIDESEEFDSEEKEVIKDSIHSVTICYGFCVGDFNLYTITPMRTHNTTIYLTSGAEEYYTVSTFLHELVHVISNVSNEESENQLSFYRFCGINEGLTELITREILKKNGLEKEIMDEVSYDVYFPYVYALMDKVDLIHGYFHSEDFDTVFEGIERDWIDVYYMLVEWNDEENLRSDNAYAYWAYSQF